MLRPSRSLWIKVRVKPKPTSEWNQTLALKGQARCQPETNTCMETDVSLERPRLELNESHFAIVHSARTRYLYSVTCALISS